MAQSLYFNQTQITLEQGNFVLVRQDTGKDSVALNVKQETHFASVLAPNYLKKTFYEHGLVVGPQ